MVHMVQHFLLSHACEMHSSGFHCLSNASLLRSVRHVTSTLMPSSQGQILMAFYKFLNIGLHITRTWAMLNITTAFSGIGSPEHACHLICSWFLYSIASHMVGEPVMPSSLPVLWSLERNDNCVLELMTTMTCFPSCMQCMQYLWPCV